MPSNIWPEIDASLSECYSSHVIQVVEAVKFYWRACENARNPEAYGHSGFLSWAEGVIARTSLKEVEKFPYVFHPFAKAVTEHKATLSGVIGVELPRWYDRHFNAGVYLKQQFDAFQSLPQVTQRTRV
jgi:hypothetical protein